ncbi:protease modulator HflC [Phenylobacterium sp.]|uniref:protease modulator HflC n=1 Tax=Phenylobacterium sp. TaxID=1871053 RepID=UPI002BF9BC92|nr:protease modulator HflC [Phenylobacterium sp.]HLZ73734.1 protease modulator HflC [Phenylobacterium sp.]
MSRSTPLIVYAILIFVGLIVVANSLFIVEQREEAVVLRFGQPERVIHAPGQGGAGLNFKQPFLENVVTFDRRNQALEADQEEIVDGNQERLVVDAFLRYRIADPLQYYRTLRDEHTAQDRLERLVNSSLRQVLGSSTTDEIISGKRDVLMQQSKLDVAKRAKESQLGIQVIDLRIKRVDLPPGATQAAVYRRMQTQRQQIAAQTRANGEQQKREIFAAADKEVTITLANAQQQGETTRGEGDAQRTRIFAQAYGKDPGFAAFYRSMLAYEAGLGQGDTTMILAPDSAFFKYFEQGPSGGGAAAKR